MTTREDEDERRELETGDPRDAGSSNEETALRQRGLTQAYWAVLPPLWLLGFISYLDRANLSYVAADLGDAIGLTDEEFGAPGRQVYWLLRI
jgi:hypothetical protein